jgi:hypothetical protein
MGPLDGGRVKVALALAFASAVQWPLPVLAEAGENALRQYVSENCGPQLAALPEPDLSFPTSYFWERNFSDDESDWIAEMEPAEIAAASSYAFAFNVAAVLPLLSGSVSRGKPIPARTVEVAVPVLEMQRCLNRSLDRFQPVSDEINDYFEKSLGWSVCAVDAAEGLLLLSSTITDPTQLSESAADLDVLMQQCEEER